uniref:ATP synthase F0 subunit 8 n=1 Tax=Gumaga orientalis TaxID=2566641 RepID=UPI0022DCDC9F|nr:ATP synthase F0 subunit 8 [Gumaga orientalis]UZZ43977.1 ATP synthase F0 subunit 8 [Gumaga orientalis]
MPQMMPLNWILLYMFILIIFMIFFIMNYYIHINNNPNMLLNKNMSFNISNKMNWMW